MHRPAARKLGEDAGYASWLVYYPPGLRQPDHAHANAQLSFLLSGSFAEESGGRSLEPVGRSVGLMPVGESHAVRFGKEGALMLAIDCRNETGLPDRRRDWRRMDRALSRKVSLVGEGTGALGDLCSELLAGFAEAESGDALPLDRAPQWLRRAIGHLVDDPEVGIGALATEAGVHRVYFSRVFQRYTGLSPTEFRLARKCTAAMQLTMAGRGSIAQAAVEAGFADQAHWTRTCRALAGIPPGRVRQLFAA